MRKYTWNGFECYLYGTRASTRGEFFIVTADLKSIRVFTRRMKKKKRYTQYNTPVDMKFRSFSLPPCKCRMYSNANTIINWHMSDGVIGNYAYPFSYTHPQLQRFDVSYTAYNTYARIGILCILSNARKAFIIGSVVQRRVRTVINTTLFRSNRKFSSISSESKAERYCKMESRSKG